MPVPKSGVTGLGGSSRGGGWGCSSVLTELGIVEVPCPVCPLVRSQGFGVEQGIMDYLNMRIKSVRRCVSCLRVRVLGS